MPDLDPRGPDALPVKCCLHKADKVLENFGSEL